jgi:type VI secretion system protein ImpA
MDASPLLDIPTLLAAISDSEPAGSLVPFEVREQLEELRTADNPDDFAPDDPMRPATFRRADWDGIIKLAQETLATKSKDLLVAARLMEALVKKYGFAGLHDGLQLLHGLVEQCWDRLYPTVEDGDLEVRAGPFHWLDEPDYGARFPTTLRSVPLVFFEGQGYGWLDWHRSQGGRGPISREDFEKAIQATPRPRVEAVADEISRGEAELAQLSRALEAKMGPSAPALTGVRQALDEVRQLTQQILQKMPAIPSPGSASQSDNPMDGTAPTAPRAASLASRAAAYQQIEQAADVLQKLEPHSPIPYLIRRAVKLGALPFPELLKAVVRDPGVLSELTREFGLLEPGEEKS